jgi:hypothetical protein
MYRIRDERARDWALVSLMLRTENSARFHGAFSDGDAIDVAADTTRPCWSRTTARASHAWMPLSAGSIPSTGRDHSTSTVWPVIAASVCQPSMVTCFFPWIIA